ncbi:hypothetical protein C8E97_4279 [Saccharothrix australiensis]|uniref:Uncharacterized protein n=1 Tax=Saccharothrix australiensis TaxID=2072 RepID=A0A495W2A1_9PSEU|nr:hypothetical protein C8E97_4279 [Saccharothrix australiensis]
MSHVGGAIAIAVYMTMLGAGFDYEPTELLGVAVVAVGAVVAFTVLPGRRADPAPRPSADSRPGG